MKLGKREKYLVWLGAGSIAVFFLFQFIIFPFFDDRDRTRRGVRAKEEGLKEIMMLSAEYQALKKGSQGIQNILAGRKSNFTLFSFLESAAGDAEVKAHIKYMKPSDSQDAGPYKESMVEMKLEGITLKQLVGYLYRIESPENAIRVKRVSVKESKGAAGYMDAILQVLTFQ
jgi:general secretion pathway protein M